MVLHVPLFRRTQISNNTCFFPNCIEEVLGSDNLFADTHNQEIYCEQHDVDDLIRRLQARQEVMRLLLNGPPPGMTQNQDDLNDRAENLRQTGTAIAALRGQIAFMRRYYLRAQEEDEQQMQMPVSSARMYDVDGVGG